MSNVIAASLLSSIILSIISNYFTYKIEEDKIISIQSAYQESLITAQNNVIAKEREGQAITQKVSKEYEDKIAALTAANKLPANANGRSMPQVSPRATRTPKTCKIKLAAWQKWYNEQSAVFNRP